jgi:hypothetical protein
VIVTQRAKLLAFLFRLFTVVHLVSTVMLLMPLSSISGEYALIKGKEVDVCEAYKKNLESFDDSKPMACERKINSAFKDFEKPVWQKVDLEQHRELFRRLLSYQTGDRNQFSAWWFEHERDFNRRLQFHKEQGYRFVDRTHFDIDNDTRAEDLILYRMGYCPEVSTKYGFSMSLYVLTEVPSVTDAIIAEHDPAEKLLRTQINSDIGRYTSIDLFRFKGASYVDKYCVLASPASGCATEGMLTVYKLRGITASEVCVYHYQ